SASPKTPGTRPSACCRCCRSHLPSVQRTANLRLRTGAGEGEIGMWRDSSLSGVLLRRRWFVVAAVVLVAAAVGLQGAVRAPAASPCATPTVVAGSNFE